MLLIVVFLLLPKPWLTPSPNNHSTVIEIELSPNKTEPVTEHVNKPVAEPKEFPVKPTTEPQKQQISKTKQIKPLVKQRIQKPTATPTKAENVVPKIKPSSGEILLSTKNRTSVVVSTEFQARSVLQNDFVIPSPEIENWLADIPYLDESVDRPTIQMKFYAAGIEGSIEKFFDKITISKTFTTKYGTKIHCALIGVIAACGWK